MAKKLTHDICMVGRVYMKPDGTIYKKHSDWFEWNFSKIPPDSALYKQIVETYGTKKGKTVRLMTIKRLIDKGEWRITK